MKTKDEVLKMVSHEQIRAMADMADAARETDSNLADAADMVCMAMLAVRDAVKRGGAPHQRWMMMSKKCGDHLARVIQPAAALPLVRSEPLFGDSEPEARISQALYLLQLCQQDLNMGRKSIIWPRAKRAREACQALESLFSPNKDIDRDKSSLHMADET